MPNLDRSLPLSPLDSWLDLTAESRSLTTTRTALMALPSATEVRARSQERVVRSLQGTAASWPERHSTTQRKATAPPLALLCWGM